VQHELAQGNPLGLNAKPHADQPIFSDPGKFFTRTALSRANRQFYFAFRL
jgi:hypothetical protein